MGGDRVLQLSQLGQPLVPQPGGDGAVQAGRVGAGLLGVGEEPAPVELGLLQEPQQLVVVGLGLAGVADDEAGPEGGVGLGPADGGDPLQELLAAPPAPHPAQQPSRDVLQRQVEVGHPGGDDGVDQLAGEVRRVQVQQPDPLHQLVHRLHQRDDPPPPPALVPAVGGQVLGHQHRLFHPEGGHLFQDRLEGPAALGAPEAGDGAEPAGPVASLGDLHIGPRPGRRGPGQVEQVHLRGEPPHPQLHRHGGRLGRVGAQTVFRRLVGESAIWGTIRGRRGWRRVDERGPEASHPVGLGQGLGQFVAVTLGQAAGDHQPGRRALGGGQLQDGVDRLPAGLLDEGAGVDHHHVGRARPVGPLQTAGGQRSLQLVRVDLVLGAAQRLYVIALRPGVRHPPMAAPRVRVRRPHMAAPRIRFRHPRMAAPRIRFRRPEMTAPRHESPDAARRANRWG